MSIPFPFIAQPIGLGRALTVVIEALFGGGQCLTCQHRATALDHAVTFVPIGGVK